MYISKIHINIVDNLTRQVVDLKNQQKPISTTKEQNPKPEIIQKKPDKIDFSTRAKEFKEKGVINTSNSKLTTIYTVKGTKKPIEK
jgi:hypothetical protein